ncbi:MAG: sigma-70 family RNA polymerase sigma factor, partial [Aureliella sp.]
PNFLDSPDVSPFVWMRRLTLQCVVDAHRHHFRQKRSVGKEVKLSVSLSGDETSRSIVNALFDPRISPSQAAVQAEELERMRRALDAMDETDREVLALRHFERLSNNETAEELGLSVTAASNRYIRAMARLADLMKPNL